MNFDSGLPDPDGRAANRKFEQPREFDRLELRFAQSQRLQREHQDLLFPSPQWPALRPVRIAHLGAQHGLCAGLGTASATFTPSLATIDLDLYHANGNFTLGSLVAASSSTVDNVQYVFDRGLTTGEYALQVTRVDTLAGPWNYALAWQLQNVPHWAAPISGSWNNAANWTSGVVPSGAGREADLDAPTTTGLAVTLDASQTIGQLTLSDTASSSTGYTISAGRPDR